MHFMFYLYHSSDKWR